VVSCTFVTIVFKIFMISKISLLLPLSSSSIRNSGNGCFISHLVILFIVLACYPIFSNSSYLFFVFVFGCSPLAVVYGFSRF
jgi:hypothetical protein